MPPAPPDHCVLEHHLFGALGPIAFRRSGQDGAPVMILTFGEREASVPLRSLQREFAIPDDSPDGRMLALIAESLDFVAGLHPGDPLPTEILTGAASWQPDPRHRALAESRLRLHLLAWLDPTAPPPHLSASDADTLRRLDADPALRQRIATAFARAAEALGLPSPDAVIRLVETLADELAYIEALRERLLRRVRLLAARLDQLARTRATGDLQRLEPVNQVIRLTGIALTQIATRFEEIDAQTGEILSALRNAASQCSFIRANRDYLYRCQRAWEPILLEWDNAAPVLDDWTWHLIGRTYHFLAPRYMPVTEWQAFATRQSRATPTPDRIMTW